MLKVVMCSSEVYPFAKTGGLGDVCGALPRYLVEQGCEVSVFLPKYRGIDEENYPLRNVHERLSTMRLEPNIDVFFVDYDRYFDREGLYGEEGVDYADNLDRFQFFCSTTLEAIKMLQLKPDIIHCHDWQTALIPIYLNEWFARDEDFQQTRTLLTIHNMAFQGVFPAQEYPKLRLPQERFSLNFLEFYGQVNLLKGGMIAADQVSTVSAQYAKEVQTKEKGCGLENVISQLKPSIKGIINGLDTDIWDPARDDQIIKKYEVETVDTGKRKNKEDLQKRLKLAVDPSIPLFGFVGRLTHQKGLDIIKEALTQSQNIPAQFVIQGVGDKSYYEALKNLARTFPQKISVVLAFDEDVAHQIYAGSDFFMMPSEFEPCGLSQLISLRYGTIPIVFKTGGLADTIKPYAQSNGNGFVFTQYETEEFVKCVKQAVKLYRDDVKSFSTLRKRVMNQDYSWKPSAKEYVCLYESIVSKRAKAAIG